MKNKKTGGKNSGVGIFVVFFVILAVFISSGRGGSSSHKSRYSELSPQEQENARWAYEVQKELNERN